MEQIDYTLIKQYYDNLRLLLEQNRLGAVCKEMESIEELYSYNDWANTYRSVRQVLSPMKQYLHTGAADPERVNILEDLRRKLAEQVDRFYYFATKYSNHSYENPIMKLASEWGGDVENIDSIQHDLSLNDSMSKEEIWKARNRIFRFLVCSPPLTPRLYEVLTNCPILSETGKDQARIVTAGLMVSSLFLGLNAFFCPVKFRLIKELTHHPHPKVAGWASAALFLLSAYHSKRLSLLGKEQLSVVIGNKEEFQTEEWQNRLSKFLLTYYPTFTTQEDHERYKSEVTSRLEDMARKMNIFGGAGNTEEFLEQIKASGEDSELMQAMSELQTSFAKTKDIHYHTTTELRRFPFFYEPVNWLMPFDLNHFALSSEEMTYFLKLLPFISQNEKLCSGDLYAYACMGNWSQIAKMSEIPSEALSSIKPLEAEDLLEGTIADGIRDFIYTTYRFFHLERSYNFVSHVFSDKAFIVDTHPALGISLPPEQNRSLSSLLLESGYKSYALMMLKRSLISASDYRLAALLVEKISDESLFGSDAISSKDLEEYLLEAHRLDPLHAGTLLKLGDLKSSDPKTYNEAYQFLDQAEQIAGSNIPVLSKLSQLYAKIGDDAKALDICYKAYVLTESPNYTILRRLALQLYKMERYEDALEKWGLLPEEEMKRADYMYKGHALAASGQIPNAIESYKKWKSHNGGEGFLQWQQSYTNPVKRIFTETEWGLLYDSFDFQ
ncbi:MAG: hypothetical protein Q3998_05510 [Porphyromonas sp.]|nr:hypothetical protein [Porphyromonas sp.]